MEAAFVILSGVTVLGAIAAMSLRSLVHCALCLVVAFAGLAALFLRLNAQFVGFAQIFVYIGAVAILIVFAILLTRSDDQGADFANRGESWSRMSGVGVALLVFMALSMAVLSSSMAKRELPDMPAVTVEDIGSALMADYVLPLEAIALLLTAALIGAVLIAMPDQAVQRIVAESASDSQGSAAGKKD